MEAVGQALAVIRDAVCVCEVGDNLEIVESVIDQKGIQQRIEIEQRDVNTCCICVCKRSQCKQADQVLVVAQVTGKHVVVINVFAAWYPSCRNGESKEAVLERP